MKDGLWRVEGKNLCAGFVVERGKVVRCAPILWLYLWQHWQHRAVWVCP
jgi:hypothetical protein